MLKLNESVYKRTCVHIVAVCGNHKITNQLWNVVEPPACTGIADTFQEVGALMSH